MVFRNDGEIYALKKIKLGDLKKREIDNTLNEVRILASISNPHVISKTPKISFFVVLKKIQILGIPGPFRPINRFLCASEDFFEAIFDVLN